MVISSFFMVLNRVTNNVFSITSPVTSPIFTLSPTINARMYVITKPAMILPIADDDPNEMSNPKNTLTPLKIGESLPGR